MFATVIARRIKSRKRENWYVLAGTILPFAPVLGMKLFMPPSSILTLTSILWDCNQGCFHLMAGEYITLNNKTPEKEADHLIEQGPWTKKAPESEVMEAERQLVKKTMEELKSKIIQAQMAQGIKINPEMLKSLRHPNGPRRH